MCLMKCGCDVDANVIVMCDGHYEYFKEYGLVVHDTKALRRARGGCK